MYGDNGIWVDFEEIGKDIAAADVLILGFAHFQECLLIDARANEREAPLVQVVDPASSFHERLSWIRRRRPSLGPPQSPTFVGWRHSVSLLVKSGVWDRIRDKAGAVIEAEVRAECDLALRQIQNLETSAMQALLKGERCLDLWPRPEVPEARV